MFEKSDVKGENIIPVYAFLKKMTGEVGPRFLDMIVFLLFLYQAYSF